MMGYGVWMAVSSLLSALLGGGLVNIINRKAQKRKADSDAKNSEALAEGSELNNVEKAIKIWREMAECLKLQNSEQASVITALQIEIGEQRKSREELTKQIEILSNKVNKLNTTSNKILKMLNSVTHENLDAMVAKMKIELQKDEPV
jgi:uncharacterized coiled-coil protein SlyX